MAKHRIRIKLDMSLEVDGAETVHKANLPALMGEALVDGQFIPDGSDLVPGARWNLSFMDEKRAAAHDRREATRRKKQEARNG